MSVPTTDPRVLRALAALLAGLAVAAGALAAHALEKRLTPEALAWWDTAAKYHFGHAIALWLAADTIRATGRGRGAALAFLAGILLFSGSLYALGLTGERALGAITPFGGGAFLVGWGLLALCSRRGNRHPGPTQEGAPRR